MFAFQISGDSMTLPDGTGLVQGAWVLVDSHDLFTSDGHVFAFRMPDGSLVAKRYRLLGGRPGMYSDNVAYAPQRLNADIRNQGRVYAYSVDGQAWAFTKYRAWGRSS
ncbi:S24 family peptidase [Deinococcus multiflagellatus]|uniref:Helix-turn-helix transcriptional regulator n=2 Tax=Deinococcus multiflagellatus TaxID=1656887 RepID=A0ABW1ZGP8_9DEIO